MVPLARAMALWSVQWRAAAVQCTGGRWRAPSPSRAARVRRQLDEGVWEVDGGRGGVQAKGACEVRPQSTERRASAGIGMPILARCACRREDSSACIGSGQVLACSAC